MTNSWTDAEIKAINLYNHVYFHLGISGLGTPHNATTLPSTPNVSTSTGNKQTLKSSTLALSRWPRRGFVLHWHQAPRLADSQVTHRVQYPSPLSESILRIHYPIPSRIPDGDFRRPLAQPSGGRTRPRVATALSSDRPQTTARRG